MCGLFGWYLQRPDRRVVPLGAALSVLMDLRGTDSWGFYAYPHREDKGTLTHSPIYKRGLGTFAMDVPSRGLKGFTMVMAHCRAASVGDVTVENAHPFHIGSVVGAHNGGIRNWNQLNKEYNRDFDVDSQHIFAHIDEQRPLKELHGYGAITYVHKDEPQRVHMCRWNAGTLAVARVFYGNNKRAGVVWASTLPALAQGLGAAGFEWSPQELTQEQGYFVEPDEEGVPDLFGFDYKYDFGSEYGGHTKNSKSGSAASTGISQAMVDEQGQYAWCATCRVVDREKWHTDGKAHHALPGSRRYPSDPTNGRKWNSDPEALLRTELVQAAIAQKKEKVVDAATARMSLPMLPPPNPKPQILVANEQGELVPEDDMPSCAICYGPPGPPEMFRTHPSLPPKALLCMTCYGELCVAEEIGRGEPALFQKVIGKIKRDLGYPEPKMN